MTIVIVSCNSKNEESVRLVSTEKMHYVHWAAFSAQRMVDGEPERVLTYNLLWEYTSPDSPNFDPTYTELVLVHSEEEAAGFPDNVLVAWPDERFAEYVVLRIIEITKRDGSESAPFRFGDGPISLEQFGLSYPLEVSDLVDNWEKVYEFFLTLNNIERWNFHWDVLDWIPRSVEYDEDE